MNVDVFDDMGDASRAFFFKDEASGLRAILCIDDLRLGPAAGGVRTWTYESTEAALADARRLSRAMSIKCALAGLNAGGGKTVVLAGHLEERERAFEILGERVEELQGLYRCAGDLGTSDTDLQAMARRTKYVHTNSTDLSASVARGALRCLEALVETRGRRMKGLRVAVQGCGSIGTAVAQALAHDGAELFVADLDPERAQRCAAATGARVLPADAILLADVDVLVPCATGHVITEALARQTPAFGICGAANNVLATLHVAPILAERGIHHVPDVLASAGAVIDGIGETVMSLDMPAREALIDGLKTTTTLLLKRAVREGRTPEFLAWEMARERIRAV
ncbi:MAG: leucine dehydrogenase [Polyangiales bacterium]|jgi:leucine dehydrogenase